jgi:hypothetical protein
MDLFGTSVVYDLTVTVSGPSEFRLFESGLALIGSPTPGSTVTVRFACPSEPDLRYAVAAARNRSPGFALPDGRTVPLSPDALTRRSLRLPGFVGRLGGDGTSTIDLSIPDTAIAGSSVWLAGVTLDGPGVPNVVSIAGPVKFFVLDRAPQ